MKRRGAVDTKYVKLTPEDLGLGIFNQDSERLKKEFAFHRARAAKVSKVRKARDDPNAFMEYAFTDDKTGEPFVQADVHREMQKEMSLTEDEDVILELPRDHGKTSQLEGNAIWELGNDPNLRIKIVCANDSKAIERLFAITQHLEQNTKVKDVFPHLRPAQKGDWSKHKVVVERDRMGMRDASIEALGVLATATGGRCDRLYFDDAVDRRNALEMPKLRESVKVAVDADWSNLMEPGGKTIWTCTPWHTSDCTHHLKSRGIWKVLRYPVGPNFEPVWSEKFSEVELRKRLRKIGQREYDRAFRLVALSGEWAVVRDEWITYWVEPPNLGDLVVFAGYDLSTGEGEDYFACVTIGVDGLEREEPTVYVLDAWRDRLSFGRQATAVKRETGKWMPTALAIEATQYQAVLPQFLKDTSLLPDVQPVKPRLSKGLRLSVITPMFERGQVFFNPALAPTAILDPDGRGDLVTELIQFPLGAHDDMLDAFVHAMLLALEYCLREQGVEDVGIDTSSENFGDNGDIRRTAMERWTMADEEQA